MTTKLGVLTTVVALVAALGFAGTASAGDTPGHDTCEVGGGAGDIYDLSASYDATNDQIEVVLLLCDTKANNIKYRVHFDHTAPFFDNPPASCATTSDDTMKRFKGNKDTGPGDIVVSMTNVSNDTLTYTVDVDDLDPTLMVGDTVFIWADTQRKGIIDRAPNTDGSDGCAKPEVETEVVALTLESPEKIVFVTSSSQTGNLGGLAGADAICQGLADAESLGGVYLAWLSDTNTSPDARFTKSTGPYELVDGTLIADDYADLIDCTEGGGSDCLAAFINLNELGVATVAATWTGTNADGTAFNPGNTTSHCNDWTTASGGGVAGRTNQVDVRWTKFGALASCANVLRWFCFEQ